MTKDHLHMCGEYLMNKCEYCHPPGSPPHVWRIQSVYPFSNQYHGITSTCVENTKSLLLYLVLHWDHLHMCGEYTKESFPANTNIGSPPHVWRIHDGNVYVLKLYRITSTCVENTCLFLCKEIGR